ncbi:MAG: hypothetical protein QME60_00645 [Verrucomicrobiota bacterium]|nr:hypothetical protein [Verrucomicrobiota bacterium]
MNGDKDGMRRMRARQQFSWPLTGARFRHHELRKTLVSIRLLPLAGFPARFENLEDLDEFTAARVSCAAARGAREKRLSANLRFTTFYPGRACGRGYCKLAVYPENALSAESRR